MRFFRIPNFTGIESHRDDADRGTLRIAEGCIPSGPGGLRSGPVWTDLGSVSQYSTTDSNWLSGANDGKGNSLLFASRNGIVHDTKCFPSANTKLGDLGTSFQVAVPGGDINTFNTEEAYISSVGNQEISWGDGSDQAMFGGADIASYLNTNSYPENTIYKMEYSQFPKCKFFIVGPSKCIFASGNPSKPLTIYISEPAGLTVPERDSPYSTELATSANTPGILSTVDILMSNATKITALSNRGNQVIVHTDAGAFLLYAPTPDQAEDGYRVAQAPSTVTSAAVNQSVTGGEDGTQPFYLGHDGQIYKDEASSRGSEETDRYSDPDQASWKAKGRWEKGHPVDLSKSFAAYDPESGQYWAYLENEDYARYAQRIPPATPTGFTVGEAPSAPTALDAVFDLGSIAPTAPTSLETVLDRSSIEPSAPFNFKLSAELLEPSAPTRLRLSPVSDAPSEPTDFGAAVDGATLAPTTPTLLEALEIIAVPAGPTSFRALASLALPSAPTAFEAIHTLAFPATPSAFGAVVDPSTIVPSAPTAFEAIHTLAFPATPSAFGAVVDPSTIAPSAPTNLGVVVDPATIAPSAPTGLEAADSCNLAAPCAGYYAGGYSVYVNVRTYGAQPGGDGYFEGRIKMLPDSTVNHDDDFGHPDYEGKLQYHFPDRHYPYANLPVRIYKPMGGPKKTELRIKYAAPNNRVWTVQYFKSWAASGACSTGRCWAAGTYYADTSFPGFANSYIVVT